MPTTTQTKTNRFDIPRTLTNSTNGARRAYANAFGEPWPGSDDELRDLARELDAVGAIMNCNNFLIHMRERS